MDVPDNVRPPGGVLHRIKTLENLYSQAPYMCFASGTWNKLLLTIYPLAGLKIWAQHVQNVIYLFIVPSINKPVRLGKSPSILIPVHKARSHQWPHRSWSLLWYHQYINFHSSEWNFCMDFPPLAYTIVMMGYRSILTVSPMNMGMPLCALF